jgi:NADH-quinone oxidoreductase subunit G
VGGYLAGATPAGAGLDARAMIEAPRKAYIVLGAEPDRDFANPAATVAALGGAGLVVALSAFASDSLRECADVLLPVAPFAETSGTFVNCEGRAQSFHAVARAQGDARPAWKVLRVLGNLLGLCGFDYADSEAVRDEALGGDVAARLGNGIDGVAVSASTTAAGGLERVSDVPIYHADPLVRRAPSLARTRDAAAAGVARIAPSPRASLGLEAGCRVRLKQGGGVAELSLVADEGLAAGCVRIPAAHAATAALGAIAGQISVERV